MTTQDLADAIAARRRKQAVINAFHRTFATKDGKMTLSLLKDAFKTDLPAFLNVASKGETPHYDTIHAAIRSGQRDVILQIEKLLAEPITGEGNITTAKEKIKA